MLTEGAVLADSDDEADPSVASAPVVEWSADGVVMVEVDRSESVRVVIEPEALRSWPMEVLADRIMRLHRLALMGVRADDRVATMQKYGAEIPTSRGYPSHADIEEYRRTIDF